MADSETLKRPADFRRTYREGLSYSNDKLVVYVRKNGFDHNRVGITANKKYGGAVSRNRIKRVLKELYRAYNNNVADGYDLVFIPRKPTLDLSLREIEPDYVRLMKRSGLWKG